MGSCWHHDRLCPDLHLPNGIIGTRANGGASQFSSVIHELLHDGRNVVKLTKNDTYNEENNINCILVLSTCMFCNGWFACMDFCCSFLCVAIFLLLDIIPSGHLVPK